MTSRKNTSRPPAGKAGKAAKAAPSTLKKTAGYEDMGTEDLKKVADEVNAAIANKILQEVSVLETEYFKLVSKMDAALAPYGLKAHDFMTLPKAKIRRAIVSRLRGESRQPLEPRFVHPEHEDLTWSGRGSRPKWLRDLIEKGHDIEDFRVIR